MGKWPHPHKKNKDQPLTKGGHELQLAWPWSAEFNWGSISPVPRKLQTSLPFIALSVFLLLGHPTVIGIACNCAPTFCLSLPASETYLGLFGTISPNSASMLQGIRGQSRTSGLCQKWPQKKTHDSSWNLAPQNAKGPWKCLKNSTANSVLIQSYNSRHDSTKMPWEVIWIAEMFFDFSCIAIIEMGAETWKMSFRPPPRKRPSGMCGCRCHVWGWKIGTREVRVAVGDWKWVARKFTKEMGQIKRWRPEMYARDVLCILGLWLKTQGGRHPCLSLSLSMDISKVNMGLIHSWVIWHANIALWVNEWKRNWPGSDLTIGWFVPI